jgi:hypothetical protein
LNPKPILHSLAYFGCAWVMTLSKPLRATWSNANSAAAFSVLDVAVRLAEGGALELGEVLEPPDAQRADRLLARIDDDVGRLVVVAVEGLLRLHAVLLHEADAADGICVQQLLVRRHDLGSDLIMVVRDPVVHAVAPLYVRSRE